MTKEQNLMLALARLAGRREDGRQTIAIMQHSELRRVPAYIRWTHVEGNLVMGTARSYGDGLPDGNEFPMNAFSDEAIVAVEIAEDGSGVVGGPCGEIRVVGGVMDDIGLSQGVVLLPEGYDDEDRDATTGIFG